MPRLPLSESGDDGNDDHGGDECGGADRGWSLRRGASAGFSGVRCRSPRVVSIALGCKGLGRGLVTHIGSFGLDGRRGSPAMTKVSPAGLLWAMGATAHCAG